MADAMLIALADSEAIIKAWLAEHHIEQFGQLLVDSGYDDLLFFPWVSLHCMICMHSCQTDHGGRAAAAGHQ